MLPAPSDSDVIDQLVEAVWLTDSISYAFLDAWPTLAPTSMLPTVEDNGPPIATEATFMQLSSSQKTAINFIAGLWDDLIAGSITGKSNPAEADIKISRYKVEEMNSAATSHDETIAGQTQRQDSYVWLELNQETTIFDGDYRAMLHEFGHALGLDHAGNYNFEVDISQASSSHDSTIYTVMSYFGPDRFDGTGTVEMGNWTVSGLVIGTTYTAQTPMMDDIMAIQSMYGADPNTRETATTYGFNCSGIGPREKIYDFNENVVPVLCIYDADGEDTLDLSGWSTNSNISLIPGTFSDANGMTRNISIARNTVIENAVGGSGNDEIMGNTVCNTLVGGKGNDVLNGGARLASVTDIDTADYSDRWTANAGMTAALIVDMTKTSGQVLNDGFGNQDTLVGIEKIVGTNRSDYFNIAGSLKIVDGGDGDYDEVSFASSGLAVTINLNQVDQRGGLAEGVKLYNIEGVTGSTKNDILRLKDTGQTFASGNSGDDTIYGGYGNAVVRGGGDNDTYYHIGGIGFFDGGTHYNTVDLSQAEASFTVDFIAGTAESADSQLDFDKVQRIVGSRGADTFSFGNGILNYFFGQNVIHFNGGTPPASIDTLDFSTNTTGVQLYYQTTNTLRTSDGLKQFVSFERFIGGSGSDTFTFLNGMKEAHGGDGPGFDTLDITRWSSTNVTHYWATNTFVYEDQAVTISGWEHINYRPGQVKIVGTDAADTFQGSAGSDRIWGGRGNDTFLLSVGNDVLYGGDDNDTFFANLGDMIDGGNGYDTLHLLYSGQISSGQLSTFIGIEEYHIADAEVSALIPTTNELELELYFTGNARQTISFTSDAGRKHVELGAWDDEVRARGEGHYNGGDGIGDIIDFRDMRHLGLTLDKEAQTATWGDGKQLTYEQFEVVKFWSGQNGLTVYGDETNESFIGTTDFWVQEIFDGRGGNDTLRASGGNDILIGGEGEDTFIFTERNSTTIVKDFERGVDHLKISFYGDHWQKVVDDDVYLMNTIGGQAVTYAILENAGVGSVGLDFVYL